MCTSTDKYLLSLVYVGRLRLDRIIGASIWAVFDGPHYMLVWTTVENATVNSFPTLPKVFSFFFLVRSTFRPSPGSRDHRGQGRATLLWLRDPHSTSGQLLPGSRPEPPPGAPDCLYVSSLGPSAFEGTWKLGGYKPTSES